MLARDCMTKHVELGRPDMSILQAARQLRDGDFGALPIADGDKLVGMVTDRDIVVRGVAEGKDPENSQVRDVMSQKVLYCFDDDDTEDIAKNFGMNKIRRLPVLNHQKRLVGILSLGDLARADKNSEEADQAKDALHNVSKPGDGQAEAQM